MARLYFKVGSDYQEVIRLREEIIKLEAQLLKMDKTQTPATIATLEMQLGSAKQKMSEMVSEAAEAAVVLGNDFKKGIYEGSKAVNDITQRIITQKAVVKDVEKDVKNLSEQYRKFKGTTKEQELFADYQSAKKALEEEKVALFALTQEQAEARLSVKRLKDEYTLYKAEANDVSKVNDGIAISFKKAFAILGGAAALKSLVSNIIRVRGEFQMMDTAIETLLGSKEKADVLMKQVKEYAKISPLELGDVSSATQMMLGFNIEAEKVPKFLRAIGDISMGESSKFSSLTLAFSQMSAAGKLMGQDLNQMINAGFNPLQIMAEKTGKSIAQLKEEMSKGAISAEMVQQAFVDATSAGGKFYNMSENAVKTINGQLSMMQDALDAAFNEIGEKGEGVIIGSIQSITTLIENYEEVGKVLAGLVITYGAYRAAIILTVSYEKLQVASRLAAINGTNLLGLATDSLTKKTARLNKTLLANPYALLAASVVALGYGVYQLSKYQTDAEKSQQRLLDTTNDYNRSIESEKVNIDILFGRLKSAKEGTDEYQKAKDNIISKYGSYLNGLNEEIKSLRDVEGAYRAISKAAIQSAKDRAIAAGTDNAMNAYTESWGKNIEKIQGAFVSKFGKAQGTLLMDSLKDSLSNDKEFSKEVQDAINEFNKITISAYGTGGQVNSFENNNVERYVESIKDAKNTLESEVKELENIFGKSTKKEEEENDPTGIKTYAQDLESAKKEWENAKKELSKIEKDKDNFTTEQYNSAKSRVENAKKEYEKLGGTTNSRVYAKQTKEQNKLDSELLKLQEENEQKRINLIKDEGERKRAQIELDYNKSIRLIEEKEKEWRKAQNGKLTNEQSNVLSSSKNLAETNRTAQYSILDEEIQKELLAKYQDYSEKRLGIEKQYNKDLKSLQEQRVKAEETGNKELSERLTRSIAEATKNKGKDLISLDFSVLKDDPVFVKAFENLGNTSSETLNSLLGQLEEMKLKAANVLSPTDLREYTSTVERIIDELVSRNPFKALADAQNELVEANKELRASSNELGVARLSGDTERITKATEQYNASLDKVAKSENKVTNAQKSVNAQMDNLYSSLANIGNVIGGTTGDIIGFISEIGSFVSTTIDGIDSMSKTTASAISAIEKASVILTIISTAIKLMKELDSLIPDSYSQYLDYSQKISDINDLRDAVHQYELAVLNARHAEESWFSKDSLNSLKQAKELHEQIMDAYNQKVNEDQAKYQNEKSGGWLTSAAKVLSGAWFTDTVLGTNITGDQYEKEVTKAIENLRIETRKASKGFLGSGIGGKSQKTEDLVSWAKKNGFGDLFDENGMINKEAGKAILDQYGDKLVGQTKETLEALIELREQYDDYLDQLREYVSSLYEPLVDNFVDSMWAWFDGGKDALDSFKEYASDTFRDIVSDMLRTIILKNVVGTFSDDIVDLYNQYASGDLSEVDLMEQVSDRTKEVMDKYEEQIPALQTLMETLSNSLGNIGIDLKKESEATDTTTTKKGYQTMSQDAGDEMNGRLTGIQMATEEIKQQGVERAQSIASIKNSIDLVYASIGSLAFIADDARTIIANSYLELQEIKENTGAIIKPIKEMNDKLGSIKENTDKL